jgi:hypothetical protein
MSSYEIISHFIHFYKIPAPRTIHLRNLSRSLKTSSPKCVIKLKDSKISAHTVGVLCSEHNFPRLIFTVWHYRRHFPRTSGTSERELRHFYTGEIPQHAKSKQSPITWAN